MMPHCLDHDRAIPRSLRFTVHIGMLAIRQCFWYRDIVNQGNGFLHMLELLFVGIGVQADRKSVV